MKYQVMITPRFEKDIKAYKKRFPKIDEDMDEVINQLEKGNFLGDQINEVHLPNDEGVYKVRVANTSARQGKSGGFRLVYYVVKNQWEIYLLTIYSKTDKSNISDKEIIKIIKLYCK